MGVSLAVGSAVFAWSTRLSHAEEAVPTGAQRAVVAESGLAPPHLRVLATGAALGWLQPCDCKRPLPPIGGYSRRADLLLKESPDLRFDTGNLIAGDSELDVARLRFSLELLRELGYDAVVPGERELRLGRRDLMPLLAASPIPFVCANLQDGEAGGPPTGVRKLIVFRRKGRSILVTGLVGAGPHGGGWTATPHGEALRSVLAEAGPRADVVIVLTSMAGAEFSKLLESCGGVDLVLGGTSTRVSETMERVRGTAFMVPPARGTGAALVELVGPDTKSSTGRALYLDAAYSSDTAIERLVTRFHAGLRQIPNSLDHREDYAGSRACAACHRTEFEVWNASPHAAATRVLDARQVDDPICLSCHTTGYRRGGYGPGEETGFEGVGCESCHGAGKGHAGAPAVVRMPRRGLDPADCRKCHTAENGREFEPTERFRRIAHGRRWPKPEVPAGAAETGEE